MKVSRLVILFYLLGHGILSAQTAELDKLKDEIAFQADVMVNADLDKHRLRAHDELVKLIGMFLSQDEAYQVSLDSIPWLTTVKGDNFRLVTWQLKVSSEEYKYGGFIQWPDHYFQLLDTRPLTKGSMYSNYTLSGWYGCLYYQAVPFERDGIKYYMLMGYNAENSLVNTKLADVLDLSGPEPRFGVPVFTGQDDIKSRIIVTYADISNLHLGYDAQLGGIVHDHVETLGIGPNGEPLPVSDGSMEGWILKKGDWVYQEEVYDVKVNEPPMTDERKDRKEEKDILGRPKKE